MTPVQSLTRELGYVVLPSRSELYLMAMFGAYFDASGTHRGSPCITVAGVVTPAGRWRTFDHKWWDILEKAEVAPDKDGYRVFHMTDFSTGRGLFVGWTEEKKRFVVKKLIHAMAGRIQFVVAKSVQVNIYDAIKKEYSALQGMSAFTFCFMQCLIELSLCLKKAKVSETIAYVFERGDRYGNELDWLKRSIESNAYLRESSRWESFTTLEKRKYPALQAADVIAYEGQKEMLNFIVPGKPLKDLRGSFKQINHEFSQYPAYVVGGEINERELRKLIPRFVGRPRGLRLSG